MKNGIPEISVVIPTYNRSQELVRTIGYILSGTFPVSRYEILISDDGSTDETSEVCLNLQRQHSHIRYFFHSHSGSPARVRNNVLKEARGNIVAFTDDDTIPDRDWLEKGYSYFTDKSLLGLEGEIFTDKMPNICSWVAPVKGKRFNSCEYWYGYYLANMFYSKDALLQVNGFDENFTRPSCEDIDLAWRVLQIGSVDYASDVKVFHPAKKLDQQMFREYFFVRNSHDALLLWKHPKRGKEFMKLALPYKIFRIGYLWYMASFFWGAYKDRVLPRLDLVIPPLIKFRIRQFIKSWKKNIRKYF